MWRPRASTTTSTALALRAVRQQEFAAFARAHAVVGQISGHHLLNRQDAPGQYTAPAQQRHRAQAATQHGASPCKVMIDAVERVGGKPGGC
jgi:hypothetical protein